jgi:tRNA-Thr(GGU) m(6)t(6)A37 methyltransferase TsaA
MEATNLYQPIGFLKSSFNEKFGVPRQSMMIQEAKAELQLLPKSRFSQSIEDLDRFSHVWVIFIFDRNFEKGWRSTIRPPRVGAPRKVGVFASRSPHRPNPIGISVVQLDRIERDPKKGAVLHLSGVDFLDGTPVIDIKPYLPYADSLPHASGGWASGEIPKYKVSFSEKSLETMTQNSERYPRLQALVHQMLEWDPRPTSQRRAMPIEAPSSQGMVFGFRILDFDVKWEIQNGKIFVLELVK